MLYKHPKMTKGHYRYGLLLSTSYQKVSCVGVKNFHSFVVGYCYP